jgi:hypothetical protein
LPAIAGLGVIAALVVWFRHARTAPNWRRVAEKIEVRHPELEGRLLTAVQQEIKPGGELNYFQERLVNEVVLHDHGNPWAELIPNSRVAIARLAHLAALVLFGTVLWGLRTSGGPSLLARTFESGITVTPGDATLERGGSLVVVARFGGALAARQLKETSPGWAASRLGSALASAAEALADTDRKSSVGARQIVLLSDLKEGSRLDQLQGYEWPKGIEVLVEPLRAKHLGNAGLQLVTDSEDAGLQAGTNATVRVRVSNAADSQREQFKVGWASADGPGFVGEPVDVYVPPGQSRIAPIALPTKGATADRIRLQGDDEDFDNTVFVVPAETGKLSVIYFGNDSGNDSKQPLYFLKHAFQETRRQAIQVRVAQPGTLPPAEQQAATLLITADMLSEADGRALREQVAVGKTLLFALKSEATAPGLARLLQLDSVALSEEARPNNYAMLTEIDFQHPLFAPFADSRFSDFTRIHFWKYRRLDATTIPHARIVAKFDSGDPAVLDVPVGKGRVILLTSGWQSDDSHLALSSKFVPLLYAILDYSGAAVPPPAQYHIGDLVPLAPFQALGAEGHSTLAPSPSTSIRTPDGSQLNLSANDATFSQTMTPGIYTAALNPPKRFAVNLDAAESRTAPLPADELERLGVPMSHQVPTAVLQAQRKVRLQTAELEGRQKLWRWFVLATLAVLLVESWLAGRTARRPLAN